jgi:hypothetical protein
LRGPREALRTLKTFVKERLRPHDLSVSTMPLRHRRRIQARYLWLTLSLPLSNPLRLRPWTQLKTSHVRATIERAAGCADEIPADGLSRRCAVLLGQCSSNYADFPREFELECYTSIAREVQDRGYEVLWKEHPRTRQPFGCELLGSVPGLRLLPECGPWPVEVYFERLGLAACAGLISTSLFSIPLLFNAPAFSPARHYASRFEFPNNVLARLVGESIGPA